MNARDTVPRALVALRIRVREPVRRSVSWPFGPTVRPSILMSAALLVAQVTRTEPSGKGVTTIGLIATGGGSVEPALAIVGREVGGAACAGTTESVGACFAAVLRPPASATSKRRRRNNRSKAQRGRNRSHRGNESAVIRGV
jgi:hypothetical protein